jgi:hypothetical protein
MCFIYLYFCSKHACSNTHSLHIKYPVKHNRPLWVAVQGLIRPTPYTYKYPVLLYLILTRSAMLWQISGKLQNIKFHENPSHSSWLVIWRHRSIFVISHCKHTKNEKMRSNDGRPNALLSREEPTVDMSITKLLHERSRSKGRTASVHKYTMKTWRKSSHS